MGSVLPAGAGPGNGPPSVAQALPRRARCQPHSGPGAVGSLSHPLGMMAADAEHPTDFLYHAPVQSDPASHRAGPRCHRVHREVPLAVRAYELMIIADGDLEESA